MKISPKIFVDGQEGTTGLKIHEYLVPRGDLELLHIHADKRKDPAERKKLLNAADVAILCLPESASREAVALIDNARTRVIDASTAFRTHSDWAYGLPELHAGQRDKIRSAARVAVPGCHASAFLLAVAPLVARGLIPQSAALTCFSLTGYSGGGKKMIAAYEQNPAPPLALKAPRAYALTLAHKHLPEMQKIAGLDQPPLFTPVVCNVYAGLAVEVFLPRGILAPGTTPEQLHHALAQHYVQTAAGVAPGSPTASHASPPTPTFVRVIPFDPASPQGLDDGQFDITACNGTNRADIFVFSSPDRSQSALMCRLDNLGKGAAGAAIQCLNIMLGREESTGLVAEPA